MKSMKILSAMLLSLALFACAGLSVPDLLAKLDNLNTECHGLVDRLAAKGIKVTTSGECDKAAAQARDKLTELLDRLRAELTKAGV